MTAQGTPIEFRARSKRAPAGGFRIVLGVPGSTKERRALVARRDLCQRIARRGEWDVLRAIKSGLVTIEEVERLVDAQGIDDYRRHLTLRRPILAPTLDEHVARWLLTLERDGTRAVYEPHLRRLRDFRVEGERLGSRPWPSVYSHHVRDALAEVRRDLAHNTARTCLGAWGSFFTWAVDREATEAEEQGREPLAVQSPVRRAKRWGQPKTTRHRFFSRAEYERLRTVAPDAMKAQYATLVWTGLRIREFTTLPPVHVKPGVISVGPWGKWVPKGYPKSTRGVRDIPIHRTELGPLLEEYAARFAGAETFFVNPRTGGRWSYAAFRDQMERDVKAAGMVYGQRSGGKVKPEGVSPHTCRHTLATWLCQADVQLVKIARLLGDTVETIERHYTHWLPTDLDRAINGL